MQALFLVLLALSAPPKDRFIGIVEIPALGAIDNPDHDSDPPPPPRNAAVVLYKEPEASAATLVTITDVNQLVVEEFAYEAEAPVVYARAKGFYLIRTPQGTTGWLAAKDAGKFHAYRDLAGKWAGAPAAVLFTAPDTKSAAATVPDLGEMDEQNLDIRVIESKEVDGALWFKVQVLQDVCEEGDMKSIATAWLPAHTSDGAHTIFFRTRGC